MSKMSTCRISLPKVHLHTITSASEWPPAIQSITSLLAKPLPEWMFHNPYSSFASYLIAELEAQALATAEACSSEDNSSSLRLKETYNLVISSCADLRTLAARPSIEPMLIKTITFSLVTSLFRSFASQLNPRYVFIHFAYNH